MSPDSHLRVLAAQEHRRLIEIGLVARIVDGIALGAVVQIRAGLQLDGVLHHGCVEAPQQRPVTHGLVRGVGGLVDPSTQERAHQPIQFGGLHRFPLLELHDHRSALARGVLPGEQQVDALGGVVDAVLDRHPQFPRDGRQLQHVADALQGVLPGAEFLRGHLVAGALQIALAHLLLDALLQHVLQKHLSGGQVDDHGGRANT